MKVSSAQLPKPAYDGEDGMMKANSQTDGAMILTANHVLRGPQGVSLRDIMARPEASKMPKNIKSFNYDDYGYMTRRRDFTFFIDSKEERRETSYKDIIEKIEAKDWKFFGYSRERIAQLKKVESISNQQLAKEWREAVVKSEFFDDLPTVTSVLKFLSTGNLEVSWGHFENYWIEDYLVRSGKVKRSVNDAELEATKKRDYLIIEILRRWYLPDAAMVGADEAMNAKLRNDKVMTTRKLLPVESNVTPVIVPKGALQIQQELTLDSVRDLLNVVLRGYLAGKKGSEISEDDYRGALLRLRGWLENSETRDYLLRFIEELGFLPLETPIAPPFVSGPYGAMHGISIWGQSITPDGIISAVMQNHDIPREERKFTVEYLSKPWLKLAGASDEEVNDILTRWVKEDSTLLKDKRLLELIKQAKVLMMNTIPDRKMKLLFSIPWRKGWKWIDFDKPTTVRIAAGILAFEEILAPKDRQILNEKLLKKLKKIHNHNSAQLSQNKTGGIDMSPSLMSLQVKKDGNDFKFDFNGTEIDAAQVSGVTFTIRSMTPVSNLLIILGLQ